MFLFHSADFYGQNLPCLFVLASADNTIGSFPQLLKNLVLLFKDVLETELVGENEGVCVAVFDGG